MLRRVLSRAVTRLSTTAARRGAVRAVACVRARNMATAATARVVEGQLPPQQATVARFAAHGTPGSVVRIERVTLPRTDAGDVLVKLLAAPVNPADINMIEGTYKSLPPLPATGGNEGVFEVLESGTSAFKAGDWVIPKGPSSTTMSDGRGGTWTTRAMWRWDECERVPNTPPPGSDMTARAWLDAVATVGVNPCTAYRMLHDFVKLRPGDVVVQNAATSGVGQAVIQLARRYGWRTVNIIRDASTPGVEGGAKPTADWLRSLGADVVLTESELAARKPMLRALSELRTHLPKLAFNAVGGDSATNLLRFLKGAPLVTYGGMSKKPIAVPTGALIFNDVALRGFWLSEWVATHSHQDRRAMIDAVLSQRLQTFTDYVPVRDALSVLNGTYKSPTASAADGIRRKVLLVPGSD